MQLVSETQFNLARVRRSLEKAHKSQDWDAVRRFDNELASSLDAAFEDENRDARTLVNELEAVLLTYSKIISELPGALEQKISPVTRRPF